MSLVDIVLVRGMVDALCAEIDAGRVKPTEVEMLAFATLIQSKAGPLAHDLLCKLASRCKNGRSVLARMAN